MIRMTRKMAAAISLLWFAAAPLHADENVEVIMETAHFDEVVNINHHDEAVHENN